MVKLSSSTGYSDGLRTVRQRVRTKRAMYSGRVWFPSVTDNKKCVQKRSSLQAGSGLPLNEHFQHRSCTRRTSKHLKMSRYGNREQSVPCQREKPAAVNHNLLKERPESCFVSRACETLGCVGDPKSGDLSANVVRLLRRAPLACYFFQLAC